MLIAYAEHTFGFDSLTGARRDMTRLATRAPYAKGGYFLSNIFDVHVPFGSEVEVNGKVYRLVSDTTVEEAA